MSNQNSPIFTGNIYIFHAFDIGKNIQFKNLHKDKDIQTNKVHVSKLLKHCHLPLEIELPHPHNSARCISSKIHEFGAISLTYKVPITGSLHELQEIITTIDEKYQQDSVQDAHSIYKKILPYIIKPAFFQMKTYYTVIQIDTNNDASGIKIKQQYGNQIAALLKFETKNLSTFRKNEILKNSISYFEKDLVIIDTNAAFLYDPEYNELLDIFEFANIQQLELYYFDKLLDKQLTILYEEKKPKLPLLSYMPFIGSRYFDPMSELNRIKVDISVITERLESGITLIGETYFSEIYEQIVKQLNLINTQKTINKKLFIIQDIKSVYQSKIDANRVDLLTAILIFNSLIWQTLLKFWTSL
ncbi:MAG: hypothetical protein CL947_00480 [Epsilonproteobacteria bacterium]|nr:hypothetical protein [Campylobacterota bacterium]|tara:strand:+ start:236 stop:1309 length:1074 start_codon:yes stop_codon:yes gene_type:complete